MTTPNRTLALALSLAFVVPTTLAADAPAGDPADLSLEELLNVDVQTASRKSQRLQDVAAAVFVISRDDIERSGAASLPEVLRLAPGVEVARLANNRWAVSARGFNGRFANKLLVLLDGRSIYSPLFSGVLWEGEDTLLDDIERIEVIRGPGASLWGANAVNGVINIITRKARDTGGTLAVVAAGTEDRGMVALRQGMAAGDGNLRVWGRALKRDRSVTDAGDPANDTMRDARAGFRGDWTIDASRRLTVSGGVFESKTGDTWFVPSLTAPSGQQATNITQIARGVNLLARHEWTGTDGSETALQGYIEHDDLGIEGAFHQRRNTIDLDFQNRPRLGATHDVIWGLGYRATQDNVTGESILSFSPERTQWHLVSGFVQDEITVVPEKFRVIVGTKLEHNSFTGFEPQPNLRMTWTPTAQQTVWGSWSRAARTPSRAERTGTVDLQVVPGPGPVPVLIRNVPDPATPLGNEIVRSFELGLRRQFDNQLSVDVALFDNSYDHLRSGSTGGQSFDPAPVPHAVQVLTPNNGVSARTRGMEVAVDWHVSPSWRLQPSWSTIRIKADANSADPTTVGSASAYESNTPRHQLSLRSSTTLSDRSQFDAWLRHVTRLTDTSTGATTIPAYTTLDLRYAWRLRAGLELSITGQNLLDPQHPEQLPELLPSQALQAQRAVVVKAKWQF